MPDTKFDTASDVALTSGDLCNWGGAPVQFRFAADKKRAARVMRNCESLFLHSYAFNADLVLQKGAALAIVAALPDATAIALTFNGIDCILYGPIDPEEGEAAE